MENIGKYRVVKKISEGTSGIVYLVEADGAKFALKYIKVVDAQSRVRFRRESSTLARLNHENLVKIHDVGEFNGTPFMAMDLLGGLSLDKMLKKSPDKKMPESECVEMVKSIANALIEVHKNNLVHRDIKSANIFRTDSGAFKLIDFGLIGDIKEIEAETALVGTPFYSSPEQSRILKRAVDARSDLYSLGVTFFELITGRLPFIGSLSEVIQQHASAQVPDVRDFSKNIRPSVSLIVRKLLAKDPDDRYQTAKSLVYDLGRLDIIDELIGSGKDPKLGEKYQTNFAAKVRYVKRENDEAKLQKVWRLVQAGASGAVMVCGPSGSGKSRFSQEFIDSVQNDSLLVLHAKCQLFNMQMPFSPVREAIEHLLESLPDLNPIQKTRIEEGLVKASEGIESSMAVLSKPLGRMLQVSGSLAEDAFGAESAQDKYIRNIADFFLRISTQWKNIIFFIDDLQWMDPASIQIFQKIFQSSSGLKMLLLGTARDDAASIPQIENLKKAFAGFMQEPITLSPFSSNQITDLISEFFGTKNVDPEVTAAVEKRAHGNPFSTIDVIRSCIDHGAIYLKSGSWQLDKSKLEKIMLSDDVFASIISRFETTSLGVQKLLRLGACYGNVFNASELGQVAGMDAPTVASNLSEAEGLGLIQSLQNSKWQFVHDRIMEAVFSSLSNDVKAELSTDLAIFYTGKTEKTDSEILTLARLCQNCTSKLSLEEAVRANIIAGDIALQNFSFREAYRFFKFAFDVVREKRVATDSEVELAAKLAKCETIKANYDEAIELSNFAIRESKNAAQLAEGLAQRVWISRCSGDFVSAWAYFMKAHEKMIGRYPKFLLNKLLYLTLLVFGSFVMEWLGWLIPKSFTSSNSKKANNILDLYLQGYFCLIFQERLVDSACISFKILWHGFRNRNNTAIAIGYVCVGNLYGRQGISKSLGKEYINKGINLATSTGNKYLLGECKAIGESGLYLSGQNPGYFESLEKDKDFYRKYTQPSSRFLVWELYSTNLRFLGHTKKAVEVADRIHRENEEDSVSSSKHQLADIYANYCHNYIYLGRARAAQAARDKFLPIINDLRWTPHYYAQVIKNEAGIRRFTGEVDALADEIVNTNYIIAKKADQHYFQARLNYLSVLVNKLGKSMKTGSDEERFRLRHQFAHHCVYNDRNSLVPEHRAVHYHLIGRYNLLLGRYSLAEKYFKKSEEIAVKFDIPITLYDIYIDRARISARKKLKRQLQLNLVLAYELAAEQGWQPKMTELQQEFESEFASAISVFKMIEGSEDSGSQSASGSKSGAGHTIQSGRTIQSSRTIQSGRTIQGASTGSLTRMGSDGIDAGEVRFIDALLRVATAFTETIDTTEQSKLVLNQLVKLYGAQRGFIFLKSKSGDELRVTAGKGANGEDLTDLKGFSNTAVKKSIETAQPIIVSGTEEAQALGSESAVLYNLRSIMATPLKTKDDIVGVVYLDSTLAKGLFSQEDSKLFTTLANYIAVALELSRMAAIEIEKANMKRELDVQRAVATESKKVKLLVDNMQQALFSVVESGEIVEPVSKFSQKVFGKEIVGQNVIDILYNDMKEKKEALDQVKSTFGTVFGEDDLQWNLMEDNLPKKISWGQNTLKVQSTPLWNSSSLLEKILFVVEDVTVFENLERQVFEQRKQAELLEDILSNKFESLAGLLAKADTTLKNCEAIAKALTATKMDDLLRDLHTLKGNARMFRLRRFSEQIHNTETVLAEHRAGDPELKGILPVLEVELTKIRNVGGEYRKLLSRIMPAHAASTEAGLVNKSALEGLNQTLREMQPALAKEHVEKLRSAIRKLSLRSIRDAFSDFDTMVKDIANQLQKDVTFEIDGDVSVESETLAALQDCLVHLLRNSLDHGLETKDERLKAGKPATGKIKVVCVNEADTVQIKVQDDGRGIDADKIFDIALKKGVIKDGASRGISEKEKLALIFTPNFSSKESANDISGRGIGMNVVKENVEKLGGRVDVDTKVGQGTTFSIVLKAS